MKRSGFTLVELLAVIVVLAVIALIATPIVNNSIEKSKKGTAIESANNLISSAEYYILKTSDKYGKVSVLDENLKYSGKKPEFGEIEINKQGRASLYAYINGYCVNKDYDGEAYATKMKKEDCSWYTTDNYEPQEGDVITVDNISASTSGNDSSSTGGNSSTNTKKIRNYLIYGNTTQETRSDKNLWDFNNSFTGTTMEQNGIKFTKRANDILINGTSTAQAYTIPYEMLDKLTVGKTYTIATNNSNAHGVFQYFESGSTTPKYTSTLTITSTMTSVKAYFYINPNVTVSNFDISMQIEEGSTATKFQKYGATPSPEFPSEIKTTGDLLTSGNCGSYGSDACNNVGKYVIPVKVSGKNIFDYDNVSTLYGVKKQDNGYYTSNMSYNMISTYQTLKNYIGKDQKVTVSFDLTTSEDGTFLIYPYQTNGIGIRFTTISKEMKANTKTRITATGKVEVLGTNPAYSLGEIIIYKNGYKGSYLVNNIQFEVSEQATDYEAYNGKTTNIYLDEPLRKVGDYVDYIDYANSKVVRNTRKLVFNGKEGWWKNGDYGDYVSFYVTTSIGDFKPINGLGYSNMATVASWNNIQKTNGNYWWHFLPTSYGMRINKNYLDNYDSATTDGARVTLFKNWLKSHNVEVIQVLKTPKEESIKLPEIQTVEGTNYITVNTSTDASKLKIITNK